jgi:hypothetical protein
MMFLSSIRTPNSGSVKSDQPPVVDVGRRNAMVQAVTAKSGNGPVRPSVFRNVPLNRPAIRLVSFCPNVF